MDQFEYFITILVAIGAAFGGAYLQNKHGISQDRLNRKEEQAEAKQELLRTMIREIKEKQESLKRGVWSKSVYSLFRG